MKINNKNFNLFISKNEIDIIVKQISDIINIDYYNKNPIFIIVLKGSLFFASDLLRYINFNCEIDTISAKSYGNQMVSSGTTEISNANINIAGRHILIIEDIVETGNTLVTLLQYLNSFKPLSVEIVTLLSKPSCRKVDINVKYIGLSIPADFVVGYGMDYAEYGRNLPDIYTISKE